MCEGVINWAFLAFAIEIVNPAMTSKRDMSVRRKKEKVPPEGIRRN